MAESSRNRVTITLGRSGPVVKRNISASDDSYSDFCSLSGAKRSARDRIRENYDSSLWQESQISSNKRQRMDIHSQNMRFNDFDDRRISKDDLRLKLMQKNTSRGTQSDESKKHIDLREKLLKPARSSVMHPDSGYCLPQPKDVRLLQRIPPSINADDVMHAESIKSSYSPWTLDHIRRRSTDQLVSVSRNTYPHRKVDDLQRRPLNGMYGFVGSISHRSKYVLDESRPLSIASTSSTPHSSISGRPSTAPKPFAPYMDQLPPSNSSVPPKNSYMDGEPTQTVDGLLHSLRLGKYAVIFKAEEVDLTALKHMGENDLKELGIPMKFHGMFFASAKTESKF